DEDFPSQDPAMPVILIYREKKMRILNPWLHCLIFEVFSKTVGYNFLLTKIHHLWLPKGNMSLVDLVLDFLLVKFCLNDDYDHVLIGGPWFISSHFLTVRHWELEFKASVAVVSATRLFELV
ncbi:DUF4283 domain-containing protein, partial [Cephalotus follicularis]